MMPQLEFRRLGVRDYVVTADEMRTRTQARRPDTADEIWFLEHEPVYTQGVSCSEPVREGAPDIPLAPSARRETGAETGSPRASSPGSSA